jgi:hypothetical protein
MKLDDPCLLDVGMMSSPSPDLQLLLISAEDGRLTGRCQPPVLLDLPSSAHAWSGPARSPG